MPGEDHTNGFFVSCFVRADEAGADEGSALRNLGQDSLNSSVKRVEKRRVMDEPEGGPQLDPDGPGAGDRAFGKQDSSGRRKKKKRKVRHSQKLGPHILTYFFSDKLVLVILH